jgi:hypothetical protein
MDIEHDISCVLPGKPASMAGMEKRMEELSDSELAQRVAKLWPHREHEANIVLGQLCRVGLHRWRQLDLTELVPGKAIRFCFWCSKVEIDGTVYDA